MEVPEDVGHDRVDSDGMRHTQAIAPVGTGCTHVVHVPGDDLERFPVEFEAPVGGRETMRRRDGRLGHGGWKRKQEQRSAGA